MDAVEILSSTARPAHGIRAWPSQRRHAPLKTAVSSTNTKDAGHSKLLSPGRFGKKDASPPPPPPLSRATTKVSRKPSTGKPLVPLTERRSHEEKSASRGKKDAEVDKWEIAPDGASASREGRQFAVANVGHNGRIYLRCVPGSPCMHVALCEAMVIATIRYVSASKSRLSHHLTEPIATRFNDIIMLTQLLGLQ